ncbi:Protein SRG1 [Bienertia sinuspersici]
MAPTTMATEINVGHIDDVQEIQKTQNTTIPHRFVRDIDEIRSVIPDSSSSISDVPIIDLAMINDGNFNQILNLASACKEWGFFQVVNHGIDRELLDKIERMSMDFFMLPLEEKQKYKMAPGTVQGYGQAFVFSEQQKLDWCNMFALGTHPHFIRDPKLWPTKPLNFRKLCEKLMRCIAISLGLRGERFEEMFGEAVQATRMNYYPPCPRPELVLGLSPHSDGSALTILQKNKVLTNGIYKSVEHRAVTNMVKDRLSIVTFYAPSYEVELGPMPEFVNESNPIKYRQYIHGEYSKHYVTSKLQGKKTLEFAKLGADIAV